MCGTTVPELEIAWCNVVRVRSVRLRIEPFYIKRLRGKFTTIHPGWAREPRQMQEGHATWAVFSVPLPSRQRVSIKHGFSKLVTALYLDLLVLWNIHSSLPTTTLN